MPGLTLAPPSACLDWGWLLATRQLQEGLDGPSPPRPQWAQHWTLHTGGTQCGPTSRNGDEVS